MNNFSIVLTGSILIGTAMLSCGKEGEQGRQGPVGQSCTVNQTENGAYFTCPDGTGAVVLNGKQGVKGDIGNTGNDGSSGHDGVNGNDGARGVDGSQGPMGQKGEAGNDAPVSNYSVVAIVDPCGSGAGFNEVLLKLGDGRVMSHFTDGSREFLSILAPGSYVTGDQDKCYFTVDANNNIIDEHH